MHYGLINAAEAVMEVSDHYYLINKRPCYKIDIYGQTTGLFDLVVRIRDNWGAYIDTASIVPHQAYRHIEEGRYRKNEVVHFDHRRDVATVVDMDRENKRVKDKSSHKVPENILDLVGGYYFLRTLDYSKYNAGDVMDIQGFFDNKVYNLQIRFLGREEVKTKLGTFRSIVVAPILPENDFFAQGNPVKVWISDDLNKVPLKIQAELAIGALEIDIKEMQNLRN